MFQPEVEVVVVVVCCNERGTGVHGNLGNAFWHTTSVLGLGPPRARGILLDDKWTVTMSLFSGLCRELCEVDWMSV
jgi:hypothetical protein